MAYKAARIELGNSVLTSKPMRVPEQSVIYFERSVQVLREISPQQPASSVPAVSHLLRSRRGIAASPSSSRGSASLPSFTAQQRAPFVQGIRESSFLLHQTASSPSFVLEYGTSSFFASSQSPGRPIRTRYTGTSQRHHHVSDCTVPTHCEQVAVRMYVGLMFSSFTCVPG